MRRLQFAHTILLWAAAQASTSASSTLEDCQPDGDMQYGGPRKRGLASTTQAPRDPTAGPRATESNTYILIHTYTRTRGADGRVPSCC
jgi:hypothetical protein